MRIAPAVLLAALAASLPALPAAAQAAVEVRGGASVGNYEFAAAGLETIPRAALSATASYQISRTVAVYAGYSRAAFGCEEGLCTDSDVSFTSAGAVGGVRLQTPWPVWARAGLAYHSLATAARPRAGAYDDRSDPALGLDAGVGLSFPLLRGIRLVPGIGYQMYSVSAAGGSDRVTILSADLGLRVPLF